MEAPVERQEKTQSIPTIAELFLSFLRLGATAFGGPAMLVYINEIVVKQRRWMDPQSFKDGVTLAQSLPGATMMQAVAYVGLQTRGLPGAIISYVAFGLPAFLLMLALSTIYTVYGGLPKIMSVFSGLQVIVIAITSNAAFSFGKSHLKHYTHFLVAAASALAYWLGMNPVYVAFGALFAGMLLFREKSQTQTGRGNKKQISFIHLIGLPVVLACALVFLSLVRPDLFRLALLMMKINLFAFGGGFASLPLMLQEIVQLRGWMDARTFMDGIALGQVTPGPFVITATFVGYLTHGFPGAIIATVAIFSPSFMLIVLTAPFFNRLKQSYLFVNASHGVLASFVGILVFAVIRFSVVVPWDLLHVVFLLASLAALLRKVDLLYIILTGSTLSFFLF